MIECFKIYIEKYFKLYDFLVINLIKVLFVLEYIKFYYINRFNCNKYYRYFLELYCC